MSKSKYLLLYILLDKVKTFAECILFPNAAERCIRE